MKIIAGFEIAPGALEGKRAVVTGTSGLAVEIARGLAAAGAGVVLAGRDPRRGAAVLDGIRASLPGADLSYQTLDLARLASVRAFAARARADWDRIDILVNNAAVMALPGRRETADGFELMFGTNHLGHFALARELMPLLVAGQARVVSLSSGAHKIAPLDFDDLQSEKSYRPMRSYGRSKLACLMFAKELQRRSEAAGWGLTSVAAHPGFARTDGVYARLKMIPVAGWIAAHTAVPLLSHPPAAAARAILFAAAAPEVEGGGNYGPQRWGEMKGPVGVATTSGFADRQDTAARLWAMSEDLVVARGIG